MNQEDVSYFQKVAETSWELVNEIPTRFNYEGKYLTSKLRETVDDVFQNQILPVHAKERIEELYELLDKLTKLN